MSEFNWTTRIKGWSVKDHLQYILWCFNQIPPNTGSICHTQEINEILTLVRHYIKTTKVNHRKLQSIIEQTRPFYNKTARLELAWYMLLTIAGPHTFAHASTTTIVVNKQEDEETAVAAMMDSYLDEVLLYGSIHP